MDKHYQNLFKLICQTSENLAELAKEANEKDNNESGLKAAQIMHEDFMRLRDIFASSDFNDSQLNKADYAKLMVGAYFVITQVKARLETEKKALAGYQLDLIPKLDQIVNAENEEKVQELASYLFQTPPTENIEQN